MKATVLFFAIFFCASYSFAQKSIPLPKGTVFGTKPNTIAMLNASAVETFMGKKTRISTTIKGKIVKVTKTKGGWFEIDAGKGKIINAHFQEYNISIPVNLAGHYIVAEGVAQKQFIADDSQHLAGSDKEHGVKADPKQNVTFEVKGLMVE